MNAYTKPRSFVISRAHGAVDAFYNRNRESFCNATFVEGFDIVQEMDAIMNEDTGSEEARELCDDFQEEGCNALSDAIQKFYKARFKDQQDAEQRVFFGEMFEKIEAILDDAQNFEEKAGFEGPRNAKLDYFIREITQLRDNAEEWR